MRICNLAAMAVVFVLLLSCKGESTDLVASVENKSRFSEPHRPQFHFTPEANWMNDPNGMFHLNGEYHLFYQYYPDSTVWGPMHWGHAVSEDLVRWKHLPVALTPDSLGYIFSGSAVVDYWNSSGFSQDSIPPIVAAFTHHDPIGEREGTDDFQVQSLAYSLDKGYTWTKYDGNPVVPNDTGIRDFRDPKIIWHPQSEQWIMTLAVYDRVQFYGSPDLKKWQYLSEFGIEGDTRLWECPDLFPMRVPDSREYKWVLIVSIQKEGPNGGTGTSYFVGDFDGTSFQADPEQQQWLDYGADNYAFVTWDNAPATWGRRLGIGWMSNWQYAQQVPTTTWRSAMTVPRVLELRGEAGAYHLNAIPMPSLAGLRGEATALDSMITQSTILNGNFDPSMADLDLEIDLQKTTASVFGVTLSNEQGEQLEIAIDRVNGLMRVDRTQSGPKGFSEDFFKRPHDAPLDTSGQTLDLRLLFDVASVEIFGNRGALNFTDIYFPSSPYSQMEIWARDGELHLSEGMVYAMNSIWE